MILLILFKPKDVQKILNGDKTQTRRLGVNKWNVGSIHMTKIKFSEESEFAKVMITKEPFQQELRQITSQDAMSEGGFTIHDTCKTKFIDKIYARMVCKKCIRNKTCFQLTWISINKTWKPTDKTWVVNFQRVREKVDSKIRVYNSITF